MNDLIDERSFFFALSVDQYSTFTGKDIMSRHNIVKE